MICPRHCARSQKGACEVRAMLRVLHISLPLLLLAASACKSWGKFWQTEIVYPSNPLLVTQNVALSPVTPSMPGAAQSCSVSPALPEGLSLASDCTISGTPTAGQPATTYQIAADIGSGTVSGTVTIRVLFQPRFLYSANSIINNNLLAFTINSDGSLTSSATYTAGTNPRFVLVHPHGKFLYVANHGSNDVSTYQINASTGALTPVGATVSASLNPYSLASDPQGKFLFVGHEGTNTVAAYTIEKSTGILTAVLGSPFSAGTTLVSVHVDPTGNFLYVGDAANVTNARVFRINQVTGALSEISGSPFLAINDALSVHVHPSGKFVYYISYFGQNVVAFQRDAVSGALSQLSGSPFAAGAGPAHVVADLPGRFLYVANSGDATGTVGVSGFSIDSASGSLTPISGSPFASPQNPIGLALAETGGFAYACGTGNEQITAYNVNQTTGALGIIGSVTAGTDPFKVAIAGSNP